MAAGRHDGSNLHDYFQRVTALNNSWILHPLAEHPLSSQAAEAMYRAADADNEEAEVAMAAALLGRAGVSDAAELAESYSFRVFAWITRLLESLQRARQSTVFLQRFPAARSFERKGISASDWLEYHYAFYTITMAGVVDLALLLTNDVWKLGNEERDCRWHVIVRDGRLPADVVDALTKIDAIAQRTRGFRNHRVHRGKPIDFSEVFSDELAGIFQFLDAAKIAFQRDGSGAQWIENAEPLLRNGFKLISTALVERVTVEVDELNVEVEQLFDALLPRYVAIVARSDQN